MTEAYQNKAKAKAKKAYDLLMGGVPEEQVVKECGFNDVSSMMWFLREKGIDVSTVPGYAGIIVAAAGATEAGQAGGDAAPSGDSARADQENAGCQPIHHAKVPEDSASTRRKKGDAIMAISAGEHPEAVARRLGYKSARSMMARFKQEGVAAPLAVIPEKTYHGLTPEAWRGDFFRFEKTVQGAAFPLPDEHVLVELLSGELSDMIDDMVAGGIIPLQLSCGLYGKYAALLRAAADELQGAAEIFAPYAEQK